MADWPGNLPATPLVGFSEQRQRNVVTFKPEVGPPKLRRQSTAVVVNANCTFEMSNDQVTDFLDFYVNDLEDGSIPFGWNHPITGNWYSWVFDPDEAPSIEQVAVDINYVTFKVQRLP